MTVRRFRPIGAPRIKGWDDITADLSSGKTAGSNVPTWSTFRNGINAFAFSATGTDEIWVTFHVKHDYAEGTNVYPHVHWGTITTATGTVRWGFEYTVAKGHQQEAFPATTTVYVEDTISSNDQYGHRVAEVSDNDAFDAFEADTLILMRIFRDGSHANDTFAQPAFAFTADIHFETSPEGTVTKNKAPPFND